MKTMIITFILMIQPLLNVKAQGKERPCKAFEPLIMNYFSSFTSGVITAPSVYIAKDKGDIIEVPVRKKTSDKSPTYTLYAIGSEFGLDKSQLMYYDIVDESKIPKAATRILLHQTHERTCELESVEFLIGFSSRHKRDVDYKELTKFNKSEIIELCKFEKKFNSATPMVSDDDLLKNKDEYKKYFGSIDRAKSFCQNLANLLNPPATKKTIIKPPTTPFFGLPQ
jgi:hypothetical protein